VVVPTLVETPSKEVVLSLTAEDFALTDDGVPQKPTLDLDSNRPLALVILMQTGGTARTQFANYAHLETMLAEILGKAPNKAAIVNFDSRPESDCPFTSDLAQWTDAINDPEPGDGGAAIYDGLAYALNLLQQQPPNVRRAILLISQQHDDGSKTKLKDIVRTIAETNTAVYSLTFSAEKAKIKQAFKGSGHANKPIEVGDGTYQAYFDLGAPLALALGAMQKNLSAEVASLSGGEAGSFSTRGDLDRALNALTNHLHNSYMLSFSPTSGTPGLHTLNVQIAPYPDLIVKARANYWLTGPAPN
jgi:VWFA-related protein